MTAGRGPGEPELDAAEVGPAAFDPAELERPVLDRPGLDRPGLAHDRGVAGQASQDATSGSPPGPVSGVRRARHRTRRRRLVTVAAAMVGAGLVVAVIGMFWVMGHLHGSPGAEVDVTVPDGATTSDIADLVAAQGVVSDGWLFRLYVRYEGGGGFQAGKYALHRHEGYRAALRDLRHGPAVKLVKLTIPEGFTLKQIAERVGRLPGRSAARFLDAAGSGAVRSRFEPAGSNNLEGLVFPDTYLIRPDEDEQTILQEMVDQFDTVGTDLGLDAPGALPNGLNAYQTIVVASIIEREAKIPDDRGKVARVILNRLQRGMKLQVDATVLYALGVQKTALTTADLAVDSPFNTYRIAGLPPAPISNPGKASLVAALNPTPGQWLYYVLADASGRTAFATNERDFLRLKAEAKAKGLLG